VAVFKRMVRSLWRRGGWARGSLVLVPVLVIAVVYSKARGSDTGGTVTAKSRGYTYEQPKGWHNHEPCGDGRIASPGVMDDGCTKPELQAEPGVYLLSQAIAANRTPGELSQHFAGTVKGYQACTSKVGEDACLRNTANPDYKGVVRIRMFKERAVIVVCLRTDQPSISRGCDLVYDHVKLG